MTGASVGPATNLPLDAIRIHWLGQAGFVISGSGGSVVIDPWFTEHELRLSAPTERGQLPADTGWLLATHGHADHLDLPALPDLLRRFPGLQIVLPSPLLADVRAAVPSARAHGVQPGDHLDDDWIHIDVVPAWHGVTVGDGYSRGPVGEPTPHVGYVVRIGNATIYHAGDTISAPEIVEAVRAHRIDVALLPTNGRDAEREAAGILGNLDATEAARFAAALGARIAIPMHYDMVRGNTAPAGELATAMARLGLPVSVVMPTRQQPIELYVSASS